MRSRDPETGQHRTDIASDGVQLGRSTTRATPLEGAGPAPASIRALLLLCVAQFVVVLDQSIVNVALPAIQRDFEASASTLQWVISGYALTFGGFLMVGGRAADLYGRRRIFMIGLALFSVASLVGGLATSEQMLIAARVAQGLGAALVSPAALSLITTIFVGETNRRRALSAFAAAGSAAFAAGVVFGGILTSALSWRWVLLINVPIGAVALLLAPRWLPERRDEQSLRLDLPGAICLTGGFLAVIYGLTRTEHVGWASPQTTVVLVAAIVLLAVFVAVEQRSVHPLVPLHMFRWRVLTGANVVMFLASAAFAPMFLFGSQYMQQVLDFTALEAGLGFVPMALAVTVCSGYLSAKAVARYGTRPVVTTGMMVMAAGLFLLTQNSVDGSYWLDVLPAILVVAMGIGTSFTAVLLAATSGVPDRSQGVASGLIGTSQQIGSAVGIAALVTIASARTDSAAEPTADALLSGYHAALAVAVAIVLASAVVAWATLRTGRTQR